MMFKKFFLSILLTGIACNAHATSSHEIRTWGVVSVAVVAAWAGIHCLTRQNYSVGQRIFDVALGLGLLAAGFYGIGKSDTFTRYLEHYSFN